MCTYRTEQLALDGSGKGKAGWFQVSQAMVYFDHPYNHPADHTLNLDFINPGLGPGARVAVELDPVSARRLAEAITALLNESPLAAGEPATDPVG